MNRHLRGFVIGWVGLALLAATAGLAWGQRSGFRFPAEGDSDEMAVSAQFSAPAEGKPGWLYITARIKPEWYTYSITQPPGGPNRTKIKPSPSTAYRVLGEFKPSPPPTIKAEPVAYPGLPIEAHAEAVTWYAPIELTAGVDPKGLKIEGTVNAQRCDEKSCLPPKNFPFTAVVGPDLDLSKEEYPAGKETPPGKEAPPGKQAPGGKEVPGGGPAKEGTGGFDRELLRKSILEQTGRKSFWGVMAAGFLGGILMNLMPCVLPVIGLKIFSFVEQSGHDRRTALALNVWYSLGLLAVFWVLAALAVLFNLGWGEQFQQSGFNVVIAAVVFAMGLSFLEVWEIPIPGFVGRGSTAALAEQEGAGGAFSKGVITTILATPCTGPFMGAALAWAFDKPPATVFAVFTSVGLGMASPFLVIGAMPELVRFLPKPGAWMDTVKQIMGFLLLGTVVYILTFMETSYVVPTVGLLFAIWAGCWWITRTPPTAESRVRVRAWLEAAALVGVIWVLLFPGIKVLIPTALLERGFGDFRGLQQVMADRLKKGWQPFTSPASLYEQIAARNTVMVDFTADWCPTCKWLEATVLDSRAVRDALARHRIVPLKADYTQQDPEVAAMLDLIGARQVPVLAIFPAGKPNEPIVFFNGGYTLGMVLDALEQAGPSKPAGKP
jgi:thiol:disulfide interchange protein DsbD